ncbi:hypothetical protein COLO4_23442 [Corchorus olitorius]|uniref:Uncharacterized protein n=1 Tax=Corchorus olitorius TaxID=93759 RepID=A0A1R3IGL1_9ROSI|nr:hypothetical protein COLO4_23442 [Corchorus olitorius]
MAANTQQFGSREDYSKEGHTRRINEVSTHSTSLEQQLQETNQQVVALTDLFNANFSSVPKSCGICKQGQYTDKCPSLEHTAQEVNAIGMQGAYQRKPEPYWRAEQPSQQYGNQAALSTATGNRLTVGTPCRSSVHRRLALKISRLALSIASILNPAFVFESQARNLMKQDLTEPSFSFPICLLHRQDWDKEEGRPAQLLWSMSWEIRLLISIDKGLNLKDIRP